MFSSRADDGPGLEAVNRPGQLFAKRQNADGSGAVDGPRARADAQVRFEANLREVAQTMREAELHFEIATCHRLLGDYAQARKHYLLASDLDGIPLGSPSSYKRVLEDVSVATGSLYLDIEPAILDAAERIRDGLVGYDFVIDAMHPTLRAHQLIALAIVERFRAADSPLGDAAWRGEAAAFPTPEEILQRDPSLAYQERLVRGLSCLLLEWNDCAQAEARTVLAFDPANAAAKQILALARRQAEQSAANPIAHSR